MGLAFWVAFPFPLAGGFLESLGRLGTLRDSRPHLQDGRTDGTVASAARRGVVYRECRGTASSSFVSGRDCRSTVKVIGQQEWRASQLIGSFGERVWLRWCLLKT